MDLLKSLNRQGSPSLTVGAGFGRRGCLIGLKAPSLSLADGGATGGAGLGELPGGGPKSQAEGPSALSGMGTIVCLGEQMCWDPPVEERCQLVDGGGAGGLDGTKV